MTKLFDNNDPSPMTGAAAIFKLKQLMKSAGFTVTSSGDGSTTFSTSSDVITQSGTGANGLNNNSAWFTIQQPSGGRQFQFQRGTSSLIWTCKYSFSAGFTGGSPSNTVATTATDSQTTAWNATSVFLSDNTYRVHCMADNAAPYGVYMVAAKVGGLIGSFNATTFFQGAWMYDPLVSSLSPSADVDQSIIYAQAGSAWRCSSDTTSFGYLKKGLAGEGYVNIPWLNYAENSGGIHLPIRAGTLQNTGQDLHAPVIYARSSGLAAPNGYKGVSSLLTMMGTARGIPDLQTIGSNNDRIVVGDFTLPWDGSAVLR